MIVINSCFRITLVNTEFGDLKVGLFSGLFSCADYANQGQFVSSSQDFFLNSIEIFYHFHQNSIASDGVKTENSRNYEHNMELKPVFFVNLFP